VFSKRDYLMLYFHHNAFDVTHPVNKELGIVRNKLNTVGTNTTLYKLEKLLKHFSFCSISQFLNTIEKDKLMVVNY
jgi:hypothetical protein